MKIDKSVTRVQKFVPFYDDIYDAYSWNEIIKYREISPKVHTTLPSHFYQGKFIEVGISLIRYQGEFRWSLYVAGYDDSTWNRYYSFEDAHRIYTSISTLSLLDIEELNLS